MSFVHAPRTRTRLLSFDHAPLSKEDYESLIETLELLSIPGFLESIKEAKKEIAEGKTVPMEEVFDEESKTVSIERAKTHYGE